MELGLKESIRKAKLLGFKSNSVSKKDLAGIWRTHNLRELSRILAKLLESLKIGEYEDWNESKEFLDQWQDADPYATFGKYSMFKNGDPYSVKGNVYAGKIVEMGMNAIDTLDSLLAMLEEYLRMQSEYNREIGREYKNVRRSTAEERALENRN